MSQIWIITGLAVTEPIPAAFKEEEPKFSYLISPYDTIQLQSVLHHVFIENPLKEFSLTIDLRNHTIGAGNDREWAEYMAAVLNHPAYHRLNGEYLINFITESNVTREFSNIMDPLSTHLKSLGFEPVRLKDIEATARSFDERDGICFVNSSLFNSSEHFYDFYISRLTSSEVPLSLFLLNEPGLISNTFNFKLSADTKIAREEQSLFHLIKLLHKKSATFEKAALEQGLTKKDLQSKKEYLDFLLKKSRDMNDSGGFEFGDIVKIKKFYYLEYEVLPLWYKRFGHIIKVIIGRRTFKSLFNDNVRKYK